MRMKYCVLLERVCTRVELLVNAYASEQQRSFGGQLKRQTKLQPVFPAQNKGMIQYELDKS